MRLVAAIPPAVELPEAPVPEDPEDIPPTVEFAAAIIGAVGFQEAFLIEQSRSGGPKVTSPMMPHCPELPDAVPTSSICPGSIPRPGPGRLPIPDPVSPPSFFGAPFSGD